MDPVREHRCHGNSIIDILSGRSHQHDDSKRNVLALNVLLLGDKQSGRSSVGNALIGGLLISYWIQSLTVSKTKWRTNSTSVSILATCSLVSFQHKLCIFGRWTWISDRYLCVRRFRDDRVPGPERKFPAVFQTTGGGVWPPVESDWHATAACREPTERARALPRGRARARARGESRRAAGKHTRRVECGGAHKHTHSWIIQRWWACH